MQPLLHITAALGAPCDRGRVCRCRRDTVPAAPSARGGPCKSSGIKRAEPCPAPANAEGGRLRTAGSPSIGVSALDANAERRRRRRKRRMVRKQRLPLPRAAPAAAAAAAPCRSSTCSHLNRPEPRAVDDAVAMIRCATLHIHPTSRLCGAEQARGGREGDNRRVVRGGERVHGPLRRLDRRSHAAGGSIDPDVSMMRTRRCSWCA